MKCTPSPGSSPGLLWLLSSLAAWRLPAYATPYVRLPYRCRGIADPSYPNDFSAPVEDHRLTLARRHGDPINTPALAFSRGWRWGSGLAYLVGFVKGDRGAVELVIAHAYWEQVPLPYAPMHVRFTKRSQGSRMADGSAIEWTESTWNPVTGCTKITAGCDFCYAERFSERFRDVPGHPFESGFDLTLRPERLRQPMLWKRPRRIFVNSMSDLFHKQVPDSFIDAVFDTMEEAKWHTFQVLTKRSSLMARYLKARYGTGLAPGHIWLGVSIEDEKNAVRLKHLKSAQATVKFISFEPLIGPVGDLDLNGIDWAIVGGESGPNARPMKEEWALQIRDICRASKVAFFFKQWGGIRPKSGGRKLKGREWNQYPNDRIHVAQVSVF